MLRFPAAALGHDENGRICPIGPYGLRLTSVYRYRTMGMSLRRARGGTKCPWGKGDGI